MYHVISRMKILGKSINLNISGRKVSINSKDHFGHLAAVNESINMGAGAAYKKRGHTYVDVPSIVGITGACENIDTLFKVRNRFDIPLFFTQTGQLALEQSLQSFHSVFTVIHSGRDEEEEDPRHLRQFRLTEEEFDCTTVGMSREKYDEDKMYEALLWAIQDTIQGMLRQALKNNANVLKKVYKRDIAKLEKVTKTDFLRINYEEAVKLLNKNGFPSVKFGDDLKADHEAKIVKLLNKGNGELPVLIMKYPKEIKFFNMKVSARDPRVCLSADLIFPYAGEGTGAAVREHDYDRLYDRLVISTMYKLHVERGGTIADFAWYLNIMKSQATNPHAGYGIGNERVLQYIFGESDIRNVSLFSLLNKQTGDWDKKHYGQAGIVTSTQKHILLTIGRMQDKKYLLPFIKRLSKRRNFVFYTTEHTHKFLNENNVLTSLVYKISQIGKAPNISDLISRRVFDLIINIPTREKVRDDKSFTDGKLIRRGAIEMGISLITDPEVASMTLENLAK